MNACLSFVVDELHCIPCALCTVTAEMCPRRSRKGSALLTVQVLTSKEFAAMKASGQLSRQHYGGWTSAEQSLSNGALRPVKRPRTDDDVDIAAAQEAQPCAARSKLCIIM